MRYCFLELFSLRNSLFRNSLRVCCLASAFILTSQIAHAEHPSHKAQHHKKKHHTNKVRRIAPKPQTQVKPAVTPVNNGAVPVAAGAMVGGAVATGIVNSANGNAPQQQGVAQSTPQTSDTSALPPNGSVPNALPVPRFVSLRADEINMRKGPGLTYPITMVYHRKNMPVKILRDFDVWRLVEDVDGEKGWMQGTTLSGTRTFIISGKPLTVVNQAPKKDDNKQPEHTSNRIVGYLSDAQLPLQNAGKDETILRSDANNNAAVVAVLKSGVVGTIKECPAGSDWCKVTVQSYTGWLPRSSFWGLLPQEVLPTK